jgi:multicomponent Na+:H+ antiporter subunit F
MLMSIESPLLQMVIQLGLIVASLLTLFASWRVIRGPSVPDRVVGLDTIATNVVAIGVLFSLQTGQGLFINVSLVLAIIGFISTVTVAKYVIEGDIVQQ